LYCVIFLYFTFWFQIRIVLKKILVILSPQNVYCLFSTTYCLGIIYLHSLSFIQDKFHFFFAYYIKSQTLLNLHVRKCYGVILIQIYLLDWVERVKSLVDRQCKSNPRFLFSRDWLPVQHSIFFSMHSFWSGSNGSSLCMLKIGKYACK
jgi:hypothetical protein